MRRYGGENRRHYVEGPRPVHTPEIHARMKADPKIWASLKYVGLIDDGEEVLELRNCECLSTLGKVITNE